MIFLFVFLSLVSAACVVALVIQVCFLLRQKRYALIAFEELLDRSRIYLDRHM